MHIICFCIYYAIKIYHIGNHIFLILLIHNILSIKSYFLNIVFIYLQKCNNLRFNIEKYYLILYSYCWKISSSSINQQPVFQFLFNFCSKMIFIGLLFIIFHIMLIGTREINRRLFKDII